MFTIKNHRLYKDGEPVKFMDSPNKGKTIDPNYIILHYTATSGINSPLSWLCTASAKVSAHLLVGKDGAVYQLVLFNRAAWHAGESYWNGLYGMNSYSIGIEMVNNGSEPYTDAQVQTVLDICQAIINTYNIEDVIGHHDVAPTRKQDPGKYWKMKEFKEKLGFKQYLRRGSEGDDVEELQNKLKKLGFYTATVDGDFGPKTETAVRSYQKSKGLEQTGKISLDEINS